MKIENLDPERLKKIVEKWLPVLEAAEKSKETKALLIEGQEQYQLQTAIILESKEQWLMTLNEYQEKAVETAIYGAGHNIVYPTLGLAGEAGELANKVKKVLRDNNGVFTDEIKEDLMRETSDCLWYCAALLRDLGYTMDECGEYNIQKLQSRKERGVIGGSGDNR